MFCRYHGEKISRKSSKPRTADRQAIISTVYDNQQELQKSEPLLRRHDHYTITYRDPVQFKKAESEKNWWFCVINILIVYLFVVLKLSVLHECYVD